MKKPNNFILIVQAILTVLGAITSVIMFKNSLSSSNILTILTGVIYVAVYVIVFVYAFFKYKNDDKYFKLSLYGYAALLGIEILYSGKMIEGFGLGENVTLIVNIINLICFANVVKFIDILDQRKKAIIYFSISIGLKFLVELCLIAKMINFVQLIHILTALSVPILGVTLLVAYLHRFD